MALKHLSDGSYLHTLKGSGVAIRISMPQIEKRMRRLSADLPKLRARSLKTIAGNILKTMRKTMRVRGGLNGVPAFQDFEDFTKELRAIEGRSSRPMGGVLAENKMVRYEALTPFSSPRPSIRIGWQDFLSDVAVKFQLGAGGQDAEARFTDKGWRAAYHRKGIADVPRAYVHNPRPFMDEFDRGYVKPNLQKWVDGYVRRTLANQIAREMRKARAA